MQRLLLKSLLIDLHITAINAEQAEGLFIDAQLLDIADITEYEQLEISHPLTNMRVQSFALRASAGSGAVILSYGLRNLGSPGSKISLATYCLLAHNHISHHWPRLLKVNELNQIIS
jgi:aspartate 1-decarboxylase